MSSWDSAGIGKHWGRVIAVSTVLSESAVGEVCYFGPEASSCLKNLPLKINQIIIFLIK